MFNLSRTTRAPDEGAAPPKETPPAPAALPPGHRRLVLVVDDNSVTRVLMGSRLRDAGFSTEVAAIGPATVERARQLRPDAVTLNLNVHEKAGLELLRHLRQALPESNAPIFVLSDARADRIESKAEKLGVARVFHNTGSRPHEVIKALQDWFAPRTSSPTGGTRDTELLRSISSAASPQATVDGAATETRVAAVRRELETVALCTGVDQQPSALTALLASVEALRVNAQGAGLRELGMVAQALARLIQEFITSPAGLNPPRRRMLDQALDFLKATPLERRAPSADGTSAAWVAVIAETDGMPCMAMIEVLREHGFAPRKVADSSALVPLLERSPADLVVLACPQPATGECAEAAGIRQMPSHAVTPLLFVAGGDEGDAAARLARYRPSDLITSPHSMAECAFKALMLVLNRRTNSPAKGQRSTRFTAPGRALVTGTNRVHPNPGETTAHDANGSGDVPVLDLTSADDTPTGSEHADSLMLRRGLLHVDDSWGICTINDDGAALLGCPTESLPGRNLREWIILGLPASPADAWSNANPFNSEAGTVIMSLILRRQNSSILPARFRLQKLGEGGETRWLVMLAPETATSNGSETAIFTKAAFAVDHPEDAAAQGAAAADIQTDLLRRRIGELLTISTNDPERAADAGEIRVPDTADEAKGEPAETPAAVPANDLAIDPPATGAAPPIASDERDDLSAEAPVEIMPKKLAAAETAVHPFDQSRTSPSVAERKPEESAPPEAGDAAGPNISSNDAGTMKPNLESAPENDASAESLASVNAPQDADLNEALRQRDELQQQVGDLEARLEAGMTALAAATAQVQREQSERRRQEQRAAQLSKRLEELHEDLRQHLQSEAAASERSTAFEEQLSQRRDAEAQLLAELERETAEKAALRADLDSLAGLNQALREQLQHLEATVTELSSSQQELEQRLQAGTAALAEAKALAARASEERVRLEAELSQVRTEAEAETRRSSAELARLRASLQVETLHRHRLESEALQARSRLGEAERAGNSAVTRFQLRMRGPVSTLVQSVGRLLEKDLSEEQRELAETVLTNAALVQTSLQDLGGGLNARRPGAAAATAPAPGAAVDENTPPARGSSEAVIQPGGQQTGTEPAEIRQF